MAAQVGALRVVLGANTAQFEQGMRRAQTQARATGQNIERSMSQMRVRTVQAFGAVRIAAAGLGLAMGVGVFVSQARSAFEFASSLTEASRAIGLTVEQYQILNRAALENGSSTEGMARAVGILNRTLGQARAGVPAAVQAFRALRIDPEQFTRAGDVIPRVMEAISRLRTQSEQAAAAQRLFGRGAAELLPLLIQGAAGYDRATEAARRHGLITEEQAQRADEAKDAIDGLALTIRTNLGIAIAENSGAIRGWIADFEALGSSISRLHGLLVSLRANLGIAQLRANSFLQRAASFTNPLYRRFAEAQIQSNDQQIASLRGPPQGAGAGASFLRAMARNRPAAGTGDGDLDLSPAGGRARSSGRNAAHEAARRRFEVESELARAQMDRLRAEMELTANAENRAEMQVMLSYLEQGQEEAARRLSVIVGERTQAETDRLADVQIARFHTERQALDEAEAGRLADQRRDVTANVLDLEIEAASAAADLADTQQERRLSQLHLLDLQQQQERLAQEAILASQDSNDAQRRIAQARLDMLPTIYSSRQQGVMDSTRGPLGDFLADLPNTADRANEALQRVAVDGLGSITDGIADAIMMTRSWGDVFKSVAKQIVADLLRIQIQQRIIGPLTNALSGMFAGVGGGVPSPSGPWASFGGPRAGGGPVLPNRTYLVGEKGPELLRMGSERGIVVANDQMGGGGVVVNQTINFSTAGNAMLKEDGVRLASMIKPMAQEAYRDMARRR